MKQIRCAFVASYYGPYYSNFVASVLALEKEMQRRGYEMICVFPEEVRTFEWIHMLEELNCRIYYLPYKPHSLDNIRSLRKIFKSEKINLIYSHMCGWDFDCRFAAPFTPVIWHMRMNVNVADRKKRIKNRLKFRIIGFGKTYHIAVSRPVADAINSLKPRHRCKTIYNALDFSRLRPVPGKAATDKPHKLLVFGWAPAVKGLDTALAACEILNKGENYVQLLVSAQEKTYKYIAETYGNNTPAWLTLLPPTNDVASLYEKSDAMLSASRSEGFSFCLAEAIYSGLPVVYSDIPGTSWAGEFKKSHVYKAADPEALAEAIRKCFDEGITQSEQESNRDIMERKYSMTSWVKQVMEFMEAL